MIVERFSKLNQSDFPFCLPLTNIRAGCQSEIAHEMASRRFAVLGVTLNKIYFLCTNENKYIQGKHVVSMSLR